MRKAVISNILVNILLIFAKNIEIPKYLSEKDFNNADKLSAEEIDRGIGFIDPKSEFNPKFFGGDIVHKPSKKRTDIHGYITKSSGRHWPNGRVPYEFVDYFSPVERAHIAKAFNFFHNKTCIRFVKREPIDKSYVKFVKEEGCYSDYLGRHRKSSQEVSLSEDCIKVDIIIHELMHAIGFMHEFSRPDRDNYIEINYDNMNPNARSQFDILSGELFGDWKLPFDIKSAMFYESDIGAKNDAISVMKAKNGRQLRCKPHLCPTNLDAIKINTVYNCKNYFNNKANIYPNYGFELTKDSDCSSLKWKNKIEFQTNDNPVISRESDDKKHLICRTHLPNGQYRSGETDPHNTQCIVTSNSYGFMWDFIDYEILINPINISVEWRELDNKISESSDKSNNNDENQLTQCRKYKVLLKHLKLCLKTEVLHCNS